MKYIFIINPTAGKGKVQSLFAEKVNEYFKENGGDYEIYYTSAAYDALKYSKNLPKAVKTYAFMPAAAKVLPLRY